jgi:hypothetical protein
MEAEVFSFGQALAHQAVGVLVDAELPGAMGMGEADLEAGSLRQVLVPRHPRPWSQVMERRIWASKRLRMWAKASAAVVVELDQGGPIAVLQSVQSGTDAVNGRFPSGVPGDRSLSLGWLSGVPGDRSLSLGWQSGVPGKRLLLTGVEVNATLLDPKTPQELENRRRNRESNSYKKRRTHD